MVLTISSCTILFDISNEQIWPAIRKLFPGNGSELHTLLKMKKSFLRCIKKNARKKFTSNNNMSSQKGVPFLIHYLCQYNFHHTYYKVLSSNLAFFGVWNLGQVNSQQIFDVYLAVEQVCHKFDLSHIHRTYSLLS